MSKADFYALTGIACIAGAFLIAGMVPGALAVLGIGLVIFAVVTAMTEE